MKIGAKMAKQQAENCKQKINKKWTLNKVFSQKSPRIMNF